MATRMMVHSAIGLDYLEALVHRLGDGQTILEQDGSPLPERVALKTIQDMRAKGYEVFPPCDNVDSKGQCAGHPVK